jgi:hypothetical protein
MKDVVTLYPKKKKPIDNETQIKLLNTIGYEVRCKIDKTFNLEINDMLLDRVISLISTIDNQLFEDEIEKKVLTNHLTELKFFDTEFELKQNDFKREVNHRLIETIENMMIDINPTDYKSFISYPSIDGYDYKNQTSKEYEPN